MSRRQRRHQKRVLKAQEKFAQEQEKLNRQALEKYKELYMYSTDVFLKEHARFNRADEKASRYSTMFVFLLGIVAYFDKWIIGQLKWQDFPFGLPQGWPLFAAGALALFLSMRGWFLSNKAMKITSYEERPLNKKVLKYFDDHKLLDIYDAFSRRMIEKNELNIKSSNKKYAILIQAERYAFWVLCLLAELALGYCLKLWLYDARM